MLKIPVEKDKTEKQSSCTHMQRVIILYTCAKHAARDTAGGRDGGIRTFRHKQAPRLLMAAWAMSFFLGVESTGIAPWGRCWRGQML